MGRSSIFAPKKFVNTLPRDVSRCPGKPRKPKDVACPECQSCRRFIAGLEVRPVAQSVDEVVAWMQPPRATPCPRVLPIGAA